MAHVRLLSTDGDCLAPIRNASILPQKRPLPRRLVSAADAVNAAFNAAPHLIAAERRAPPLCSARAAEPSDPRLPLRLLLRLLYHASLNDRWKGRRHWSV